MNIGISRMSSTLPEAAEVVQQAAREGFEGVQLKTNQLQDWGFDYATYRSAVGEDAPLSRGGVVFHPGCDYATWADKTARVLAFAKAGGAEHVCYCFCPPRDALSRSAALDMLQQTGRQYADAGIAFSLHNHTGSAFGLLDDLLQAADRLDPAVCGLTFDTAHAHNCGIADLAGAIRQLAGFITNVHLKDARADGQFCPIGRGVLDLSAALDALRQIGYDRWLIVDEESRDFSTPEAYRLSMRFLREQGL